jgi:uncharacterized membrane-anchored protein YitT (DUF2179 family)
MTIKKFMALYDVHSFLLMIVGVFIAALALKGFMIPNGFMDGGVTGISLLLHELFHIKFSYLVLPLNLLFFIPAYFYISKKFAIRSMIAIIVLAILVDFINIEPITHDKLLIAIFGGCLIGIGMGLVMRSGAAIDGFEILASITTKKSGFSISEVILFFNSIIFFFAAIKFGIEIAMYAIITYFCALKMMEYVVDGIEEYISLNVISGEFEEVKSLLVNKFGKGITVIKGERGYLPGKFEVKSDCDIVVAVVTRLELVNIYTEITRIDPKAFIYTYKIKDVDGGVLKRRVSH